METTMKTLLLAGAIAGVAGLGLDVSTAQADGQTRVAKRTIDRRAHGLAVTHRHRHPSHVHGHTIYYGPRYSLPRTSVLYAWPDRGYYDFRRVRDYTYGW